MTPAEYDELWCAIRAGRPAPCWPMALLRGGGPPDDPEWPAPATVSEAVDLMMRLSPMLAGEALLSALYLIYSFTGGPPAEGSFPRVGWLIKEAHSLDPDARRENTELVMNSLLIAIALRAPAAQGVEVLNGQLVGHYRQRHFIRQLQERYLAAWWRGVRRRFAFRDVTSDEPDESSLRSSGSREDRENRKTVFNGRRNEPSAAALHRQTVAEVPPLPSRSRDQRSARPRPTYASRRRHW